MSRCTIMMSLALATFDSIAEAELEELSEDALAVLDGMAWEEISVREVMKQMGWGTGRALRVVRELRGNGRDE